MIRTSFLKNSLKPLGLCVAFILLFSSGLSAQKAGGNVGLGIQIGQPTGLTLKVYNPGSVAIDFLAAWDLGDYFFLNVHGLWDQAIGGEESFRVFYGPGAFIGVRERGGRFDDNDDLSFGISGTLGLSYFIQQFEIFLQLTPRLELIERTDGDIGGGAGFRFYF